MEDPVIDGKKAEEYRALKGGSNELLIRLLEKYIAGAEEYISKARSFLEKNDGKNLYNVIHNFKGSSLTMGLMQMSKILIELETQVRASNFANVESMLNELKGNLVYVKEYLTKLS